MARCTSCNKFVSHEPEAQSDSVDLSGETLSVDVTVNLNCNDCGQPVKDNQFSESQEIVHTCKPVAEREKDWTPDPEWKEGEDQFELENEGDAEATDRLQDTDRHGKKIKSMRYMKRFYGFTLESEVKCRKCGEVFTVETNAEEQAGGFNEC